MPSAGTTRTNAVTSARRGEYENVLNPGPHPKRRGPRRPLAIGDRENCRPWPSWPSCVNSAEFGLLVVSLIHRNAPGFVDGARAGLETLLRGVVEKGNGGSSAQRDENYFNWQIGS